jgi:hypothetical protein
MISIIICSVNKAFVQQVQKNIAETIGVTWEPIIIDNTQSPKSITHIYNLGAAKAQYDILCFVHEDVFFQTQNWGVKIVESFNNDNALGLIGIAGSKYKSKTPSGWYSGFPEFDCCNITHLNRSDQKQNIYFNPFPGSHTQQVIVLDGVFLCCPKRVWEEIGFDDTLLKDFHLYDLDFSFRVAEKYKVIVTFEIDIIHIVKGGHYGNKWLESTLLWHRATQTKLPACIPGINLKVGEWEKKILCTWLIRLKHENINFYNRLNWLYNIKIWAHISAWPFVFLFLAKNIFKKKQANKA